MKDSTGKEIMVGNRITTVYADRPFFKGEVRGIKDPNEVHILWDGMDQNRDGLCVYRPEELEVIAESDQSKIVYSMRIDASHHLMDEISWVAKPFHGAASNTITEKACKQCSKMNDIGACRCWYCEVNNP